MSGSSSKSGSAKSGASSAASSHSGSDGPAQVVAPVNLFDFQARSLHGPPAKPSDRYNKLLAQCKKSKKKFEDEDFEGDAALGSGEAGDTAHGIEENIFKDVVWKRLGEFPAHPERHRLPLGMNEDQEFVSGDQEDPKWWAARLAEDGGVYWENTATDDCQEDTPEGLNMPKMCKPTLWNDLSADDLSQGALGNCWLMSAIASVAAMEGGIDALFMGDKKLNRYGIYGVWLYYNGRWRDVIVDDRVPVGADTAEYDPVPTCAQTTNTNEIWPCILEKAIAKLYGNYSALDAGTPYEGLVTLTGGVGLRQMEFKEFKSKAQLFDWCEDRVLNGCLVGLEGGGHAFSLLDAREVKKDKILRVRNPWGRGDSMYKGKWSDYDKKIWTPEMRKELNYLDAGQDDGDFWIPLDEFHKKFATVSGVHIMLADEWTMTKISGQNEKKLTLTLDTPAEAGVLHLYRAELRGKGEEFESDDLNFTLAKGPKGFGPLGQLPNNSDLIHFVYEIGAMPAGVYKFDVDFTCKNGEPCEWTVRFFCKGQGGAHFKDEEPEDQATARKGAKAKKNKDKKTKDVNTSGARKKRNRGPIVTSSASSKSKSKSGSGSGSGNGSDSGAGTGKKGKHATSYFTPDRPPRKRPTFNGKGKKVKA